MKLLFDQNLSPDLVQRLADVFPDSLHVRTVKLDRALDDEVWNFALDRGLVIVTKDSDFQERRQFALKAPGIVWIRRGNCSTSDIESLLRTRADRISAMTEDGTARFLILL